MATSGTLQLNPNTYTTDGAPNRADINWSATWNSSTLQWSVSWNAVAAGNTNSYWVTIFSGTVTFTDANGNVLDTKSMAAQVPKARGGDQLLSGSFVVGVDSLGNQTLNISGRFQIEYNGSGSDNAGTSKGSGSYALDQMAMASTFTVTSSTVGASGGASTVSISRRSPSYTHSVTWTFGSYTHTETGVGTSVTYTIPASWLNAIPNSATGVGSVTVQTYNGSTPIGSAATAQFSVTAAVNPSIGSFTSAPRGAAYNAQITNYQTVYVSGYSTALLTASSVAGAYGSTITKYEFLQNNALIAQYSSSASSYSHTTGTLSGTSIVLSVRVTDSRGKQASASITVTPKSYATPTYTETTVYRCNSSGTATNDGTYVFLRVSAYATPTENSITSLSYAVKLASSSTYGNEIALTNGTFSLSSGYANTVSWDIRVTATDKLGQSSYRYFTIPTAEYTMDFKVGGKGVAFGKVAETDNLIDSAWGIRATIAPNVTLSISSSADLDNALLSAFQTIPNNQIGYLVVTFSAVVAPFGGGVTFFTIKRTDAQWGTIEGVSYNSGNGAKVYARSMANGALTEWNNPRYISSSITAASNVTIDTGVSNVMRDGKVVSGTVRFTTSAQLTYYAYLFTGLPTAGTEVMCNMTDIYGNPIANSAYINTGTTGVRMSLPLNAGQYQVGFTYITVDD